MEEPDPNGRSRAPRSAARRPSLRARRAPQRSRARRVGEVSRGLGPRREPMDVVKLQSAARLDAVVLGRGARSASVRVLGTDDVLTVQAANLWHVVPGHVVTLALERRWRHRMQLYASGEVREVRTDVEALGLPRLLLHQRGALDLIATDQQAPAALRGLRANIAATPRSAYEMEQTLPGITCRDDPILAAVSPRVRGDLRGARRLLMALVSRDLRCIDAHAHLGNLEFPSYPEHARLHYEIGAAIGDHALGPAFSGALPWSYLDNRPFLRCLYGLGLSLWRLRRHEEAARMFERVLWLNPADEQGAGRCWVEVKAGCAWEEEDPDAHEEGADWPHTPRGG